MPSLLLVIFAIQLAIHIINTVGATAVSELAWILYNKLPTSTSSAVRKANKQRTELLRLKKEMNSVSAQDDFARWAKLRRQHDKVSDEYNKTSASLSANKAQFTAVVGTARWLGTNGLRLILQFWFSKWPMFWIPRGWLPGFGEWLLSFPRAPIGSVSVQMWSMACASVIALMSEVLMAFSALTSTPLKENKPDQSLQQEGQEAMGQTH